ncbi:energy transducer TonB [Dyella soli]|uniref:Energy transducer TonB n=1 Tax=Dyella soli TaxID=522319 RepID=A0A4R0YX52_9GAMM|nr:energy transducer TonB [Dyella soli]TCI11232.1 energy transducer TonB [Dyella soli]
MSSASLAVPRHAHPDSRRIAALSAAIAVNLIALVAAMRPMAPQWIEQVRHLAETQVRLITPPPKPVEPPVLDLKPLPRTAPQLRVQPRTVAPPVTDSSEDSPMAVAPVEPTIAPTTEAPASIGTEPVEATLAYRAVPLKYPPQALHARMQGTVLLKVLVDENGVPQEVAVEHSSGYPVLDRSAREQVLRGWKFQPATVQGRTVRAWARVPVSFDLNQL